MVHFQPTAFSMSVIWAKVGFATSSQASHAIGVPTAGCTASDGK